MQFYIAVARGHEQAVTQLPRWKIVHRVIEKDTDLFPSDAGPSKLHQAQIDPALGPTSWPCPPFLPGRTRVAVEKGDQRREPPAVNEDAAGNADSGTVWGLWRTGQFGAFTPVVPVFARSVANDLLGAVLIDQTGRPYRPEAVLETSEVGMEVELVTARYGSVYGTGSPVREGEANAGPPNADSSSRSLDALRVSVPLC